MRCNLLRIILLAIAIRQAPAVAGVYEDILAAAENGRTDEVISLMRRGMDVNTTDRDGSSLLVIATRTGNLPLVEFLLGNRASIQKPNRYGDTPLHLAVSQKYPALVEKLLASSAEINPPGWTPLHYAIFADDPEITRLLLKNGAALELRNPTGRTALMLAAQLGRTALAQMLLDSGADRTAVDYDGLNAESIARQKNFSDLVVLLQKN